MMNNVRRSCETDSIAYKRCNKHYKTDRADDEKGFKLWESNYPI